MKPVLKITRLSSLTDGIFAIAMTILVLNIRLPDATTSTTFIHNLQVDVLPTLIIYFGSFIILGTQWIGMDFVQGFLTHINRPYLWINIYYLMFVCIVPFSAGLLAKFPHDPVSIYFYAANLLFLSSGLIFSVLYAHKNNLSSDVARNPEVHAAILKRIGVDPLLYIASIIIAHWHVQIAFFILILPPLFHIPPGKVDKHI